MIELEIVLYYILAGVILLMPVCAFLVYKIVTKEHTNEIKKAKENQKKINNN